jgi:hypothetical protein
MSLCLPTRQAQSAGRLPFSSSPSVTREVFVYDLIAGFELFNQTGFQASATWIHRSREYATQVRAFSDYGSLALAYRF